MTSNIDPEKPSWPNPKISDLQANFATTKQEIELLQTTISPVVQQALDLKVDAGWLPGAPSNLPVPTGIQVVDNSNGTRDIKISWAAYDQGSLRANYLLVYATEITTPGQVITADDASQLVGIIDRYVTFKGFNPAATYKFGLAAVRSIENTVSTGEIVQPVSNPNWLVGAGEVNFSGKIGGSEASAVVYNASTALSNAQAAQTDATAARTDLNKMSANNSIEPVEKTTLRKEWDIIAGERDLIDAQAAAYGITTKRTTYLNAFTTLADYLNGGTTWVSGEPVWINNANLSTSTPADKTLFRGHFKSYYNAKIALLQEVADRAKAAADAASGIAASAAGAAASAQTDATAAKNALIAIAADNSIEPAEKTTLRQKWDAIADEKGLLDAQAATYSVSASAYHAAFTTLADYLNGSTAWASGAPLWINDANMSTSTAVNKTMFRTNIKAYYSAKTSLLQAIADEAAKRAVWSTGISGVPLNLVALTGSEAIENTLITINSNGTLSGAGTGQVSLVGLGATAFASLAQITATNVDTFLGLNAINSSHIASLTANKIAAGTLAAGVVYAGAINANQILASNLAAISANIGTVTAGSITGTAGIDITGIARFRGKLTDSIDTAIDAAVIVSNNETGATNPVHALYANTTATNSTGNGVYAAAWHPTGTGSALFAVSGSSVGAGVSAKNVSGGPALKIEGPIALVGSPSVTAPTLVMNLNADLLDGQHGSFYAPASHTSDISLHLSAPQNTWLDAIIATAAEVNYLSGVTSAIQSQLNGKQAAGSYQPLDADLTAIAALTGAAGFLHVTSGGSWAVLSTPLLQGNNLSDIGSAATSRANLDVPGRAATETISGNWAFSAQQAFNYVGASPFTVLSNILVVNLNADKLDGQEGSYYQNAGNLNAGTIPAARIGVGTITSDHIADGTITATELASLTITGANIAASTLNASKCQSTIATTTGIAVEFDVITGTGTLPGKDGTPHLKVTIGSLIRYIKLYGSL